jgi:hypothetical protein
MDSRQVVFALFLMSLLLHVHSNPITNVRKSVVKSKLSSLLETKSTQRVNERTKYYPQQEQQQQQQQQQQYPQQDNSLPQQNDRFQQTNSNERGILDSVGKAVGSVANALVNGPNAGQPPGSNGRITGSAGRISNSDSSCVACQYFVQTMVNSMTKYSSLFASMPAPSSQNIVTNFPPYYQPASYRALPPILPYAGGFANGVMSPYSRIGMIEEDAKLTQKKLSPSLVQENENEVPQPDAKGTPPQYGTPRRYRSSDMTYWRDRMNRVDTINAPNPDPMREQARYLESQMFQAVYQDFEGLCASRVPELFVPFCQPMLDKYHIISEGLHYGDRPDQICMRNDFCAQDSYVRKLPHAVFNPHNPV